MNVEEAVKAAVDTVRNLFPGTGYRPEEMDVKTDGSYDITISFRSPDSPGPLSLGTESLLTNSIGERHAAIGIDPFRTCKDVSISTTGIDGPLNLRRASSICC